MKVPVCTDLEGFSSSFWTQQFMRWQNTWFKGFFCLLFNFQYAALLSLILNLILDLSPYLCSHLQISPTTESKNGLGWKGPSISSSSKPPVGLARFPCQVENTQQKYLHSSSPQILNWILYAWKFKFRLQGRNKAILEFAAKYNSPGFLTSTATEALMKDQEHYMWDYQTVLSVIP